MHTMLCYKSVVYIRSTLDLYLVWRKGADSEDKLTTFTDCNPFSDL